MAAVDVILPGPAAVTYDVRIVIMEKYPGSANIPAGNFQYIPTSHSYAETVFI